MNEHLKSPFISKEDLRKDLSAINHTIAKLKKLPDLQNDIKLLLKAKASLLHKFATKEDDVVASCYDLAKNFDLIASSSTEAVVNVGSEVAARSHDGLTALFLKLVNDRAAIEKDFLREDKKLLKKYELELDGEKFFDRKKHFFFELNGKKYRILVDPLFRLTLQKSEITGWREYIPDKKDVDAMLKEMHNFSQAVDPIHLESQPYQMPDADSYGDIEIGNFSDDKTPSQQAKEYLTNHRANIERMAQVNMVARAFRTRLRVEPNAKNPGEFFGFLQDEETISRNPRNRDASQFRLFGKNTVPDQNRGEVVGNAAAILKRESGMIQKILLEGKDDNHFALPAVAAADTRRAEILVGNTQKLRRELLGKILKALAKDGLPDGHDVEFFDKKDLVGFRIGKAPEAGQTDKRTAICLHKKYGLYRFLSADLNQKIDDERLNDSETNLTKALDACLTTTTRDATTSDSEDLVAALATIGAINPYFDDDFSQLDNSIAAPHSTHPRRHAWIKTANTAAQQGEIEEYARSEGVASAFYSTPRSQERSSDPSTMTKPVEAEQVHEGENYFYRHL